MPSRLRDLTDADVGPLGSPKNRFVLKYNSATDDFDMVSIDTLLEVSIEDNDLPDTFADVVAQSIDPQNIGQANLDAGDF